MGEDFTLITVAKQFREEILIIERNVKAMMAIDAGEAGEKADVGETKANIMLAYRHLEDARMRLGKVIQAQDGGVSCYKK